MQEPAHALGQLPIANRQLRSSRNHMNRTVTIEDRTYQIAPMKFGQGRVIFTADADPFEANCAMVATCLNNADGGMRTGADVQALPYPDGTALVLACMELNGLKACPERSEATCPDPVSRNQGTVPGEAAAAPEPARSIAKS